MSIKSKLSFIEKKFGSALEPTGEDYQEAHRFAWTGTLRRNLAVHDYYRYFRQFLIGLAAQQSCNLVEFEKRRVQSPLPPSSGYIPEEDEYIEYVENLTDSEIEEIMSSANQV